MTRFVDFHHVPETQVDIHERLLNWARWVMVRPQSAIGTSPMFRKAKSNAWQWHTPEYRENCDILDAQYVEKVVAKLPPKRREAIRWAYVHQGMPSKAARKLGVSTEGLKRLIDDGRAMCKNLLQRNFQSATVPAN
jgi:hypothetical protein